MQLRRNICFSVIFKFKTYLNGFFRINKFKTALICSLSFVIVNRSVVNFHLRTHETFLNFRYFLIKDFYWFFLHLNMWMPKNTGCITWLNLVILWIKKIVFFNILNTQHIWRHPRRKLVKFVVYILKKDLVRGVAVFDF